MSSVTYVDILPGIDLEYILSGEDIKENIILKNPIDRNEFVFNIGTNNLTPVLQEDKSIIFYDVSDNKTPILMMPAPYMFDANKEYSSNIEPLIENTDEGYRLILKADKEWLSDTERKYPITIDPPLTTSLNINDIRDAHIYSKSPTTTHQTWEFLPIGRGSDNYINRAFIKLPIPTLKASEMVTWAYLDLTLYSADYSNRQINVHKVNSNWDSSTITWNNAPAFNTTIEDYQIINSAAGKAYRWDITGIAKDWYLSGNNHGLMLKDNNETTIGYNRFYSSDNSLVSARPKAIINYVSYSGLEGYWTYRSQSVGRAGTAYINDYNGTLTIIHNDISFSGNRLPININHVYNSIEKDLDLGYGKGWRLNLSQTVTKVQGSSYYQYIDDDGTAHFFYYDSAAGNYKDESGARLILTINTASSEYYKIVDKDKNELIFNSSGKLSKIRDRNKNEIILGYNGSTLRTVTDPSNRVVTLNYDSSGKLSNIQGGGQTITYKYGTSNQLSEIVYNDGKKTTYGYSPALNLDTVVNIDGYTMKYEYILGFSSYRVSKVTETHTSGIRGGELSISYGFNRTTFVDEVKRANGNKFYKNVYLFNDFGNTINIKDEEGHATYYKYSDDSQNKNLKNKLSLQSKMQRTIVNYLRNHNAETSNSDWIAAGSGSGTGSGAFTTEERYLGNQSLKIAKTNEVGRYFFGQSVNLEKGKTYTFSSFVRIQGVSTNFSKGAVAYVNYQDSSGNLVTVDSKFITGNSEWQRIEVTFTIPLNSASSTVQARVGIADDSGTAYFDCMQLEEGRSSNRYNMIENGDFYRNNSSFWTRNSQLNTADTLITLSEQEDKEYPIGLDRSCYKMVGEANKQKAIYQTIKQSGKAGDNFILAGWAKGSSIGSSQGRFALSVGFKLENGSYNWHEKSFNKDSSEWQYLSEVISPSNNYVEILYYVIYYNNANTVYFDGLQLYREEFGNTFTYDSKGNLVSTADLASQKSRSEFDSTSNQMLKYIDNKGSDFKYTYDANNNVKTATSAENVLYTFEYDGYGNAKTSTVGGTTLFIKSEAQYTSSDNYIKYLKDPSGNRTIFNYDENKGVLLNTTDAKGNTTTYNYGALNELKDVTKNGITNSYTYEWDRIKTISHNGFNYSFNYDALGNNTEVYVGSQRLIRNVYEEKTQRLKESEYGNQQKVLYKYDDLDRIEEITNSEGHKFIYEYDSEGNLFKTNDKVNNSTYTYRYDFLNRLASIQDNAGNTTTYGYDINNNLSTFRQKINNTNYVTRYAYDKDNRPQTVSYNRDSGKSSLEEKLIAYYTFDSNDAADLSGNGNTGIIHGNPIFVDSTRGKAIKLNGINQWVELTDFSTGEEFSVSVFLKPDAITNQVFLGKNTYSGGNIFYFGYWDGKYNVELKSPEIMDKIATTEYQHIVATVRRINSTQSEIKLYRDNEPLWTQTVNSIFRDTRGRNWSIGQEWDGNTPSDFFKGEIDEMAIFKGTLTPDEVRTIYNEWKNVNNVHYKYDSVGRLNERNVSISPTVSYLTKYEYAPGDGGSSTTQVSKITNKGASISYTYDRNGNIETIIEGNKRIKYHYDELNQLIKEETQTSATQSWDRLLAYYTFDDVINPVDGTKVKDISGNYNDGVVRGTASIVTSSTDSNVRGSALKFNGTNTWVELKDFVVPENFTVSIRLKPDSIKNQYFLSKRSFSYDNAFLFGYWNGLNNVGIGNLEVEEVAAITQYHQLVLVIKRVDGAQQSTATLYRGNVGGQSGSYTQLWTKTIGRVLGNTQGEKQGWSIGQEFDGTVISDLFQGYIDELAIYGYAASAGDVGTLFSSTGVKGTVKTAIEYTYDAGGNITRKTNYNVSDNFTQTATSQVSYVYDSVWKDLLKKYNNLDITYDPIGNVKSYNGYNYSWINGRQLSQIAKADGTESITFKYNDSGIRTEKSASGKTTKYHLSGDKVTYEAGETERIYYTYDSAGQLVSMNLTEKKNIVGGNSDIGVFENVTGTGVSIVNIAIPQTTTTTRAIRLNANAAVPTIASNSLSLKSNTNYVIEFDYWSDADGIQFHADLFPDDLPQSRYTAKRQVQHCKWQISSASANMSTAKLRFFNDITNPNPSNIYITNIKLYEVNSTSEQSDEYYYTRNAQGDIIGLFDKTGTQVVSYIYDSWGKIISVTGRMAASVGERNPYRYRGYRYDTETNLYYLNSRYYTPEWGRFINADAIGGKVGTLLSHNVFAYCFNNPVNMEDPSGYWPKWATIAVVAVAVVAIAVVAVAAPAVIPAIATAVSNAYYAAGAALTVASWRAMDALSRVGPGAASQATSASQKMETVRQLGQQGEKAANIVKNTEHIPSLSKTAAYRIPDGLDKVNKVLTEVKNVKYQGLTNQLKDFNSWAQGKGYTFILKTRADTVISGPLKELIDSGDVIHLFIGN
jgi:RHS repeat-associated protein